MPSFDFDTSLSKVAFLGSYALHTDPLVRGKSCLSVSVSVCQCVSVSVCPFEDEMTRDRSPGV